MADGTVKAMLGGKEYILRAELQIAPRVEAKTGKGIFVLARALGDRSATTSEALAVVGTALAVNGFEMEDDEIFAAAGVEGITAVYALAMAILFQLLSPPKPSKKSKNGVAVPAPN